jgi:acetylglutamate kinase
MDQFSSYRDRIARLAYLQNKFVVLKIGGKVFAGQSIKEVIQDAVNLIVSGVRLIIVLGAQGQIDQKMDAAGIKIDKEGGIRKTPPEAIPHIRTAYSEMLAGMVELISGMEQRPDIVLADSVTAAPYGEGFLQTGKVEAVDIRPFSPMPVENPDVKKMFIVSSLCDSGAGTIYNVNADDIAAALAVNLHAEELIFLSDSGVINKSDSTVFSRLSLGQVGDLIKKTDATEGMVAKLKAAKEALTNNLFKVKTVHIVGPKELAACIFSAEGAGTIIEG